MAPIDDIAKIISEAIIAALKDREKELRDIAIAGGKEAGGGLLGDIGSIADIISKIAGPAADVLGVVFPPLQLLKDVESAGGKLGSGFGIGYMLGYAGFQALNPLFLHVQHAISDLVQSEIFDPQTAAQLQARGIIDEQYGRSEAAGGNMSGEHYDKLVLSLSQRPDAISLLTMLNRGLITEPNAVEAMRHQGYPDNWITQLLGLRRQLLSPADLALAQLRGNITAETMQGYADQLGVTAQDMQVLTDNTGEPPGPEQLMEAMRRGFIDRERFDRGIRQSRVRNEWIDVEAQLAHSPMSVSEAVRAVVESYITEREGAAIAEQNGLIADHWPILVESWGRPLAHEQMLTLYHRGQATLDEVRQAMKESDVKNKYIDQAIELGRRLVPERTIVSMIDHGVIDHATGLTMLQHQGFNDSDAEALIRLGAAQRSTSHKTLTKGDILAMYSDALMNRDQALQHLKGLGYVQQDAQQMLDLADFKRKQSSLKVTERGIEASLKAHHLTDAQAIAKLQAAGLDHAQARVLVDEWLQQRATVTRTLTEAQTVSAVADKIITPDDGRTRLHALGYADADVTILYQLKGILPRVP